MIAENGRDIGEIFRDDAAIQEALDQAVADALLDHKRARNPICEWRDGKVVWIAPEDIPDHLPPNTP